MSRGYPILSKSPPGREDYEKAGDEDQEGKMYEDDSVMVASESEEGGVTDRDIQEERLAGSKRRRSQSPSPDFHFSHAPSLSESLQERLTGLFRDTTTRSVAINKTYFASFSSFWRRFEEALHPFSRPLVPFSIPESLRRWLIETPSVHALLRHLTEGEEETGLRKGLSARCRTALAIVLEHLGLRMTQPWEGERRILLLLERCEGEEEEERQEVQRRRKVQQIRKQFKEITSLSQSLSRWLIRRVCENRTSKTAYLYLCCLRRTLLVLEPSFPPSPSPLSTPSSLQAAFLHPMAMQALLVYHREKEEARRRKDRVAAQTMSALTILLAVLDLRVVQLESSEEKKLEVEGKEGGREGLWRGWKGEGGDKEDETEEEEGEEEGLLMSRNLQRRGPRRFIYPSLLPYAPSLSPALQSDLISLFRDDTRRLRHTNNEYFSHFHPFWQRFEQALPPSLCPFPPLSSRWALRQWLLETPGVQATFVRLRKDEREGRREGRSEGRREKGLSTRGQTSVAIVLKGLGLKLMKDRKGTNQRIVAIEEGIRGEEGKAIGSERQEGKKKGKGRERGGGGGVGGEGGGGGGKEGEYGSVNRRRTRRNWTRGRRDGRTTK